MPCEVTPADRDDLIARYVAKLPVKDRLRELGVRLDVWYGMLEFAGVRRIHAIDRRKTVDIDEVVRLHRDGIGVLGIAQRIGVTRPVINRVLASQGIMPRGRSAQQYARMARTSPEDRQRLAQAAHDAVRGTPVTAQHLAARAIGHEQRGTVKSRYELILLDAFRRVGIEPGFQTAVGPYNCDLTVGGVAVEIWGGNWHWYGRHRARTLPRLQYLMRAGWDILIIPVQRSWRLTDRVTDYIITETQRLGADKSGRRQYRVIWGAGEFATGGGPDDNELRIDPPFTHGVDPRTGCYQRVTKDT